MGRRIREINPYTKKDVPISSGFRILYEKVTGLLGYFSIEYVDGRTNRRRKGLFIIRVSQDIYRNRNFFTDAAAVWPCRRAWHSPVYFVKSFTRHYTRWQIKLELRRGLKLQSPKSVIHKGHPAFQRTVWAATRYQEFSKTVQFSSLHHSNPLTLRLPQRSP